MATACKACAFFSAKAVETADAGRCHFNPPVPGETDNRARWPLVSAEDWCSRFEAQAG